MKKIITAIVIFILSVTVGIPVFGYSYQAFAEKEGNVSDNEVVNTIESFIGWKRSAVGAEEDRSVFTDVFLSQAGSTAGDWFPMGLGRYLYEEEYDRYCSVAADHISKKYLESGKLHRTKATEWHRIALAVTAAGGDARVIGEYNGSPIDLIADGTYDRGLTASPGKQGINGWIWSLLALDSKRYEVPQNAYHQRQDFIVEILKKQLADGGFALSGNVSDPDITAMAVQALAPYYNSEILYEYTSEKVRETDKKDGSAFIECRKSVRQVVDECLGRLSFVQAEDGDFYSWGMQNLESTCQVIVALTSLGVDPLTDERFITDSGKTLLDGVMKYRLDNGGFVHSFTYDPDNPTALPDEANAMAGDQAFYTLVALWRKQNGMRALYDMRPEFTKAQKDGILQAEQAIAALRDDSTKEEVSAALKKYIAVEELDRNYVTNYRKLSLLAKKYQIELPKEELVFSGNNAGADGVITVFMPGDAKAVSELPSIEDLTTENYVEVVTLFEKLKNAENKDDFSDSYIALEKAYNRIRAIQAEIEDIKTEIREKLYPFEGIGLNKRDTVHSLYDRYTALSEYDRSRFEAADIEGLLKCKTQADNLYTALIVGVCCAVAAAGVTAIVVLRIKKRKRLKAADSLRESDE